MTDNEIKKLSRAELLEILIEQTKEREVEKKQLLELQGKLMSREIKISQAGSIAEASMQLNGVFEAAQEAAKQYLENIERLDLDRQVECEKAKKEASQEADQILSQAHQEADQILSQAHGEADEIVRKAKQEASQYWTEVSEKLEKFYNDHRGLRELLKYMDMKVE